MNSEQTYKDLSIKSNEEILDLYFAVEEHIKYLNNSLLEIESDDSDA